jgi:hypothetical protein
MMRNHFVNLVSAAVLVLGLTAATVAAQEFQATSESLAEVYPDKPYSPYVEETLPTRVYWGDTHLHTSFSLDAGAFGARLEPADAQRFARGEEVVSATGQKVRLARPLDFLVVADHSDNMGFFPDLLAGDPAILADPQGKEWYDMIIAGGDSAVEAALEIIDLFARGEFPEELIYYPGDRRYRDAWEKTIAAAEAYNEPGRFTAFIGYEWTSLVPPGDNLHRVVIYRDDADKALHTVPYTCTEPYGSIHPEDLWEALQAYEERTGGQVLAIAHNGNLSNGLMFPEADRNPRDGQPLTSKYAEDRAKWEPLYEVTQIKGDGETHPVLSPNDEFADFETWDKGNLNLSVLKTDDMLLREYARSGLQLGLRLEDKLGVNPYKFGMIGSTDSHTALTTADEDNFFGKHAGYEPSAERWEHLSTQSPVDESVKTLGWEYSASGYAAVWAQENTRKSIFDAMERKEVYGTTGPRMTVRFFGGWDFEAADASTRQPAVAGYEKGVPMGGDLTLPAEADASTAPSFLVAALKDPVGANLDRIQIVKGWRGADDKLEERIYDVAVSDGRTISADGRCTTPVGNTIDLTNATWSNSIGDTELITVWKDPDFDPALQAFYYTRVLEIPTPRWPAYDAKYYGIDDMPDEIKSAQQRAYTSPIWYTPSVEPTP